MADPAHKETDEMLDEIERKIRKEYLQAVSDTQEKLEDYLQRFEVKDSIKREQVELGKISESEYITWRRNQILVGERWQEMVDNLAEDYTNASKISMSIVNGYTPDAYATNFNYGTFQVESGGTVDTAFTLYDRSTVENLLKNDPELLPSPTVNVPKEKRWNKQHIVSAVTQGVLQGESMNKIARRMQSVGDMDFRAAMRNARTAVTGAENAGRVDSYKRAEAMGIELRQEWLATLDRRTRHTHRRLDGARVKVGEKFDNGCRYPGDPYGEAGEVYNCRCTLVAVVDGVNQSNAPRNSKLGEMSYDEWKNNRIKVESNRPVFELDDQGEAIKWMLESVGVPINRDNTVTLYHATDSNNVASIMENGFVGGTAPANGGDPNNELGYRTFFGYDKKWVEDTWKSGDQYSVMEVRIPVEYLHMMGRNTKEIIVEGNIKRREDGIWIPDIDPSSTAWRRRALKRWERTK